MPALARALANVLGNPELREKLAKGALAASARFNTGTIADQWIEIVEDAVAAPRTRTANR